MTDIAGRPWPSALPGLIRRPLHPTPALGRLGPEGFTRSGPDHDAERPSLSTSIDRWLELYLRARL